MSKETSDEIASIAGRILNQGRTVDNLDDYVTDALRLAGSALAQHEGGDWQAIETAPTDEWTVFMVAWPNAMMDDGWMFDFWSGRYLEEMRAKIADGAAERSPHLYWLPTHWKPLPKPPVDGAK